MIEVSENLRSLINEDSRTFRVKLVKGIDTYEEIRSFKKSVLFPNSSMSIGNALSACIECTATDVPVSITGAEVEAQITILDSEEWIKLGKFTVEKPTVQDGNVSFLAYDKMTAASNKTYTSTLAEGEHTVQEYFSDICSVLGAECVALHEDIGSLLIAEDKLSGYSCRDALAYLAGFLGRNCIVNGDGLFEMIGFTAVDYDMLNADRIAEPELSDTDCIIGYIACCVDIETTLQSGTGSKGFEFISPIMTQERLDSIGTDIFGDKSVIKVYKPGKIKQLLGDPTLEIGDVVSLEFGGNVYTVPIMSLVLDYDGGLQAEIESFELTEPSSLTLGERLSFQQKQAKNETEEFIKNFNEKLKTGLEQGTFRKVISNADGSETTYYFNTPEIENATYIFYFGAAGMAWTKGSGCWNGGNPNWQYGSTAEGDAILENLLLRTLVADLIQAGTLKSTNGKTSFNLDKGVFRSESDVSNNRKLIMEQTAGEQTFEIQDGDGNSIFTGNFSAKGLTIEQNGFILPEDDYINAKIAEWEEEHAPTTWEEYSSGITAILAMQQKMLWKMEYAVSENGLAKIVLKSTIAGAEGEIIIRPAGISFDGNSFKPFYTKGDSIPVGISTAGFITTSATQIGFNIPISRPIIGNPKVNVENLTFCIRQNNNYLFGSGATTLVGATRVTASAEEGYISVSVIFPADANAVNNSAVGIRCSGTISLE